MSLTRYGQRAPVQNDTGGDPLLMGHGTIAWSEHLEVFAVYAKTYGHAQSAERIAERGGFGHREAEMLLGRALQTWMPR